MIGWISVWRLMQQVCISETMNYPFRLPDKSWRYEKILGVTAKTIKRALEAETSGADYLGTGAIFPTTTKENAPITLISTLKTICQTVDIPVVAIGGLTSENIDQLMGTGIAGVAVVRDLMQAEDIEAKTQAFLTKLHDIIS